MRKPVSIFTTSRRAKEDLLEIGSYTIRRWGKDQAKTYIDELEACCQSLADNPYLGREFDVVRLGLRCMEQGQHIIFYRKNKEGVFISRILHQSMDVEKHL